MEDLIETVRASGRPVGAARRRILEALVAATGPLSVDEIALQVPGLNVSTVYRTLGLLEELHIVVHTHADQRVSLYALASRTAPEAVLVCQSCGARRWVRAGVLRSMRRTLECDYGFYANFAHFAISGLCMDCQPTPPRSFAHGHF